MNAPDRESAGGRDTPRPRNRKNDWFPRTGTGDGGAFAEQMMRWGVQVESVDRRGCVRFKLPHECFGLDAGPGPPDSEKEKR